MTGTGAPDLPGEGAVLLRMSGIRKAFPGTQALDGVDFEVRAGEIHALVGENGAGKTTLIKILTGVHRADGGAIELLGQPFEVHSPHQAERRGIATIYQEVHLIPRLSVAENVFLGRHPRRAGFVSWREMERRARIALGRFDLDVDVRTPAGSCPVAVQQLIAIARAVDLDARLLVMDEPTSSLAPAEVERLFGAMRRLRDSGLGIVFVAHALDQVLAISDRVTVLRNGRRVGTFETASLDRLTLVRHLLGRSLESTARDATDGPRRPGSGPEPAAPGAARARPALEVRGLERRGVVGPIDLDVCAGEIVGIAGLLGSGRTEALLLLFGADRASAGTVRMAGQPARLRSPREAIARGIGFCPEDRKADAVFPSLSLRENLAIAARRRVGGWFPSRRRELALCHELVDRLGIVASGPEQPMATLSGGNQQKVILARWLATRPLVLLLDDPTRGVDVGARTQIEGLVTELAAGGMAVVLTSSALEELLGLAGRVVVLRERRQVAELAGAGLNAAAVLRAIATGTVDAG
jgi:galactofuranose transport system ATP-binding protein